MGAGSCGVSLEVLFRASGVGSYGVGSVVRSFSSLGVLASEPWLIHTGCARRLTFAAVPSSQVRVVWRGGGGGGGGGGANGRVVHQNSRGWGGLCMVVGGGGGGSCQWRKGECAVGSSHC